jgi:type III pantothenate kinase
MANLVIDIGNSFIKTAVFEHDNLVKVEHYQNIEIQLLNDFIAGYNISRAIISSVKKERDSWEHDLADLLPVTYFSRDMAVNIKNHYRTPQTLGVDRLVAVMGAHCLYPDTDNLVIDAGSCITYDYVDAGGNYYGGSISPGLNMRYRAMHNYTAALPLINADDGFKGQFGDDTQTAMQSGVQNGIKYELIGFIESYQKGQKSLNMI